MIKTSTEPRTFKQKRSQATYDALLVAAAALFVERGFERTQTPDIAARAGVSTGAFYRYFKDKRQIFLEVLESKLAEARADVAAQLHVERFIGKGAEAAIDVVIDVAVEHMRRQAALARVYLPMALIDPAVEELRAAHEAEERASIAALIASVIPSTVIPDPLAAALVVQIAVLEVAVERAGLRGARAPGPDDAAVKKALSLMLHRFFFPSGDPTLPVAKKPRKTARR